MRVRTVGDVGDLRAPRHHHANRGPWIIAFIWGSAGVSGVNGDPSKLTALLIWSIITIAGPLTIAIAVYLRGRIRLRRLERQHYSQSKAFGHWCKKSEPLSSPAIRVDHHTVNGGVLLADADGLHWTFADPARHEDSWNIGWDALAGASMRRWYFWNGDIYLLMTDGTTWGLTVSGPGSWMTSLERGINGRIS